MLAKLVNLPRAQKNAVFLLVDFLSISMMIWLSYNLRLDFNYGVPPKPTLVAIALTMVCTTMVFASLGMYRAMLRHLGLELAWVLAKAALASAVFLTLFSYLLDSFLPRSVPFIYFFMLLVVTGGIRLTFRHLIYRMLNSNRRNVAIYGAGAAGAQVFSALSGSKDYKPMLFVDDDPFKQGRTISGLPLVSRNELPALIRKRDIHELLLAMPSASHAQRKDVLDFIAPMPVHVRTIPSIDELVSGKAKIGEFQEVAVEDLLGRDPVPPDESLLHANITGKVVMVTGSGGSIGSELCRQILELKPDTLVLFEQCEFALYSIEQELSLRLNTLTAQKRVTTKLYPVLGTVLNESKLESVVTSMGVQTIYHAAAYKHVPLVEYNVVEGIRNNVFGTLNVAKVADRCAVESCVLISTDKAVRPTNVMGASKRLAELVLQGLQAQSKTRFSMVRFGNVLGSSGSVIPLFREQIAKGGPVTVTHPEIIRYFMTIPEAAQLVIQAGAMGEGGDVFVLEMGEPVRIADLARKMIHLMGLTAKVADREGDIEVLFTGLRPGEKLFEELLIGDNVTGTRHPRIMRALERKLPWNQLLELLDRIEEMCEQGRSQDIVEFLRYQCPLDFQPSGATEDILWNASKETSKDQALGGDVIQLQERKERKELAN